MGEKNLTIKQQFEEHLKKVCKDTSVREYVISFFDDFVTKYDGVVFTPEDFETLIIDGNEVKQDVVLGIFADGKKEATAEEIFVWLFKTNIKKIKYGILDYALDGSVSVQDKTLEIRKRPLRDFFTMPKRAELEPHIGESKREARKRIKESKKHYKELVGKEKERASNYRSQVLKNTIYHELSHIFEIKTFMGGKYAKTNMSKRVYDISGKKTLFTVYEQVSMAGFKPTEYLNLKDELSLEKKLEIIPQIFEEYGERTISEILNETNALKIAKNFVVSQHYLGQLNAPSSKTYLKGTCTYNFNYNISELIRMSIGSGQEKNLRFNPTAVINRINSSLCSTEFIQQIKEFAMSIIADEKGMASMMLGTLDNAQQKRFFDAIKNALSEADTYKTMEILMGYCDILEKLTSKENETVAKLKSCVQAILIESIKNDILAKLNDPNVKKDSEFFTNFNETLRQIDNLIIYPCGESVLPFGAGTTVQKDILWLSIDKHAKKYPKYLGMLAFSELIDSAYDAVANYMGEIPGLFEEMTFLVGQDKLDAEFEELKAEFEATKKATPNEKQNNGREDLF